MYRTSCVYNPAWFPVPTPLMVVSQYVLAYVKRIITEACLDEAVKLYVFSTLQLEIGIIKKSDLSASRNNITRKLNDYVAFITQYKYILIFLEVYHRSP